VVLTEPNLAVKVSWDMTLFCVKGKGHPTTGLNRPKGIPSRLKPQTFMTFVT